MSFIFKNNDNSRPNLQVGEVLDSMLHNDCNTAEVFWNQQGFTGSHTTGHFNVSKYSGEIYRLSVDYLTAEYMKSTDVFENSVAWKKGIVAKSIFDLLKATATQLYMPNLVALFPQLYVTPNVTDEFQGNVRLIGATNNNHNFSLRKVGSSNGIGFLAYSGGFYTNDRGEFLGNGGIASIGFKYWGDVERTLNDVREGSAYVGLEIIPQMGSIGGYRKCIGHKLSLFFGAYYYQYGGIFSDSSITPENIEHKNDLPDDQNTYPGGGEDSNNYPEDDPDGLNSSGYGTFDNTNDPIDFPSMPLWDATSTGFISMWNPTVTELIALYGFMWDSDISTTLKKLFLEPMDAIISLALFPVDPTRDAEKRNVTIGHVDTEITMYPIQKQFVDFDFGSIELDEYYGAAWDYSPYTKVSIYLPYIGSQEIDVDDVMNATLHLKYRIDLLSGMCVAMLKCTRTRDELDGIVYTWQGNCAMQVPITAGSAREFINSIIQLGAMTGLALVQPAAGAINAVAHAGDEDYSNPSTAGQWVSPTMATYSALNVLGQKVHVQRGGRVDANAGVMSPQSAYIIINRPVSAIPRGWNEYAGYPSLKIKELKTQKGLTQVAYIKLNGLEATAEEISELDTILKAGVIL